MVIVLITVAVRVVAEALAMRAFTFHPSAGIAAGSPVHASRDGAAAGVRLGRRRLARFRVFP
jgi:hypothetical protein